jgi:hypothetical protein
VTHGGGHTRGLVAKTKISKKGQCPCRFTLLVAHGGGHTRGLVSILKKVSARVYSGAWRRTHAGPGGNSKKKSQCPGIFTL